MDKLNKNLSSKYLFIIGVACYLIALILGGIVSDALKTIGFIVFAMSLIALNREIKQRKKQKEEKK